MIDLIDAPLMSAAFKFSVQPRLHGLDGGVIRHETRGKHENVRVVVLPRQLADLGFPRERGPNAGIAVRDDIHSDPASAKQNATFGLSFGDFLGKWMRVIGIIVGLACILPTDVVGGVAHLLQLRHETVLHLDAGVIRCNWYRLAHPASASRCSASRSAASYVGMCLASEISNTFNTVS